MSQRERSELNELVDCYIAVWHEPDAELRRKRIAELWVEDGVQFTQSREIRGHKALEERVEDVSEYGRRRYRIMICGIENQDPLGH